MHPRDPSLTMPERNRDWLQKYSGKDAVCQNFPVLKKRSKYTMNDSDAKSDDTLPKKKIFPVFYENGPATITGREILIDHNTDIGGGSGHY